MTTTTVDILTRLDIDTTAPTFSRALTTLDAAATHELDEAGIEPGLRELVRIRASQLNGCAYCVDEHTRDAAAAGEPAGRIAAVSLWRESPFFTARERAALALTDSITRLSETHVPQAVWQDAATHLTPAELSALVSLNVAINAWNAVGVSTRAWTPAL
ncbi:carboxymuconolactone decarboxylase family protein [Ruania zhangjianzhongii]|uniref:carboxymuconolactone decarboxylase family protein n=1 Tax=Ruania zhangjianzhongii TaxID=2603206 RepID=UPI0011C738C5|nr:carboxymuconolactone decarboxylase family protein [Ruania zhangjianzhongii]